MTGSGRFTPVFQRMIDAPETLLAALRSDASDFEREALSIEGAAHHAEAMIPFRDSLAFLLFDGSGRPLFEHVPDWLPPIADLDALLACRDPRSADGRLIHIVRPGGGPLFGIWAPLGEASAWNLPAPVRAAAERMGTGSIALFSANDGEPIDQAVGAFGLTPLQARVAAQVIRSGSIQDAAGRLDISYATARETMAEVARRLNLPNTPAVVSTIVAAAFGIWPSDDNQPRLLAEMLGITPRQAAIALLISSGLSREECARAVGASTALVKKELLTLFGTLGVDSAIELARLVTEARALRLFARSIGNAPGFLDSSIEPARHAIRPDGRGTFAWSDYGPASGKPVLVVHSNWCCRAVPRPLLVELQRRGWRPIALDRPGFGGSQLGTSSRDYPFQQAIADAVQLLDILKIDRIPIVARCGAQFCHAFASAHPDRVGVAVLAAPTPPACATGKRFGVLGAFKEAFFRSPRLIEMFFRVIASQFTVERTEYLMRSITRGSPTDEALCDDPVFLRDRFRALRPFTTGNYQGGVIEEIVISHGGWQFDPLARADWVILQGTDDPHNNTDEVRAGWQPLLPASDIVEVPDGGRFLTSSHAHLVVDWLERMQRVQP